jgi:hypothetical protein
MLKALCSPHSNSFRPGEFNSSGLAQLLWFQCGAVYPSGMLREETWSFPSSALRSHDIGMKNSKRQVVPQSTTPPVDLGHARGSKLVAEWQQHGPETLSGLAVRKLRLTFAPQSVLIASAAG